MHTRHIGPLLALPLLVSACTSTPADAPASPLPSAGCDLQAPEALGGVQLSLDAGGDAGGVRGYYLTVPEDYDPSVPHALVVGYAGTNWLGEQIRPYLGLETTSNSQGVIFAYPDLQWHDFEGWGNLGGWILGPHATPADGMQDLLFTERLLDHIQASWCIDTDRIWTTGHSWGGDMAHVAACFLGDRFEAAVPIAANRPYWFEPAGDEPFSCTGTARIWTLFGADDEHFSWQEWPGQFGEQTHAFWFEEHTCETSEALTVPGASSPCEQGVGCETETRYCLYDASFGHQAPEWFAEQAMAWFQEGPQP